MVHVSTPRPSIGSALGQALGAFGGQQAQFELGKSRLQQGLANLRNQQPNANPSQTLANLIEASYYSPHIGRSLGPLYETLLSQQASGQFGKNLPPNQRQSIEQEEPVPVEIKNQPNISRETPSKPELGLQEKPVGKTEDEEDFYTNQYLNQIRPDLAQTGSVFGAVPSFDFETKQDLTPQEEGEIRQDLNAKKVLPQVQEKIIGRLREDVRNRFNESMAKYGFNKETLGAIGQKWQNFRQDALGIGGTPGRLTPYLEKYRGETGTQEELANHYFRYAQQNPINATPEMMHDRAITLLQNDMDKLDKLKDLPSMPPIRNATDAREAIEQYKAPYQDLANSGYFQALKEDALLNKDMGSEELHEALWGDQTNKELLNQIHDLKYPKPFFTDVGIKGRFSPKYKKMQDKYLDDLSGILKKLGPQDDLMLARSMVLSNEGSIKEFTDALNKAQTGKNPLKLSEFQKNQLSEIRNPRERPVWELFMGLNGWKSLVNYIRGKR